MSDADRKAQFFRLLARYAQLGRLLPALGSDASAMAEARVVLAEMKKTQAQIDALLTHPGGG